MGRCSAPPFTFPVLSDLSYGYKLQIVQIQQERLCSAAPLGTSIAALAALRWVGRFACRNGPVRPAHVRPGDMCAQGYSARNFKHGDIYEANAIKQTVDTEHKFEAE